MVVPSSTSSSSAGRRGEMDPSPAERRNVLDEQLEVEGRQVLDHADASRVVGADHAHRPAVCLVTDDGPCGQRERMDVDGVVRDAKEGRSVEGDPEHVGPGHRGGIEDGDVELEVPRHAPVRAEPGQTLQHPFGGLLGQLDRGGETPGHLPMDLVL